MKLIALALAALAATGFAADSKIEYKCETSGGSPMLHHVQEVIDRTADAEIGEQFCLDYSLGSGSCGGTIKDYSGKDGGAALMMCKGSSDEQGFRVSPPPGSSCFLVQPTPIIVKESCCLVH